MILQITNFSDPAYGRLGNQLFKFLFLKLAQHLLKCEIRTGPWLGNLLFNQPETATPGHFDNQVVLSVGENRQNSPQADIATLRGAFTKSDRIDVQGFFQYHSSHLSPFKDLILNEFRINPLIMEQVLKSISKTIQEKHLVCIHIRRGDYLHYPSHDKFWTVDIERLVASIKNLETTGISKPAIYLCSDDLDFCKNAFDQLSVETFTNRDLFIPGDHNLELLTDFTVQSIADIMMISNSSLSFFSSMINEKAKIFLRPSPINGEMIPFDPWNSHVLLTKVSNSIP